MVTFSADIVKILEKKPESLLFLPAAIFWYLFYLMDSIILFLIAAGWTALVSLLFGIERSLFDQMMMEKLDLPNKYDTRTVLVTVLIVLYAFPVGLVAIVGPIAIMVGVNNLLPESQEIPIEWVESSPVLIDVLQGALVADDLVLIILLGANLVSYMVLIGPVLFWIVITPIWWILKIAWTRIMIPGLVFLEDRFFRKKEKY